MVRDDGTAASLFAGFTHCGRWAVAPVRVFDVVFHAIGELFQQEGSLESHFHDGAVESPYPDARHVIVFFYLIDAPAKLDAFSIVCLFYRRRKRSLILLEARWTLMARISPD